MQALHSQNWNNIAFEIHINPLKITQKKIVDNFFFKLHVISI